jgi:serine/threonine protein kinase
MTPPLWSYAALAGALVVVTAVAIRLVASRRRRFFHLKRFFEDRVLSPGAQITIDGRFTIDRVVEEGGMGVVYRALDRQSGQPVALKLVLRPGGGSPSNERFARETRILAGLDHPRIARYVAHGTTDGGRAYLAMAWLEGEDLRATLARGPLSLADSLRVLVGTAEGLAAVHAQGVVHRDLKPGNIFLPGGKAADLVLLDFGLARQLESDGRLTHTAGIVGTPQYMAPEQAASTPQVVPATDIFSLGCIFHECLTGRPPFTGAQMIGVLARILFDSPTPVRELRPSVPQAWADLLARMLNKKAAARPADARALLDLLRALPAVPGDTPSSEAQPAERGDSGDQVLVSVVLATPPGGPGGRTTASPPDLEGLRASMSRFNCPIECLLDGSVVATIVAPQGATDQARIAARCALSLRERWPEARVAVTTGPAPLDRSSRIGDAVDRAARLVESTDGGSWDAVRLDALTAGLLDPRFVTASRHGVLVLLAENPALDESRPLMGKPTPCVGREVELDQLEGLLASAVEESAPRAAVVLGPPGIGKSRLRHELTRRLQARHPDVICMVGCGDPLNAGSPYAIVGDALRRRAGMGRFDDPAQARARVVELCQRVAPAERQRVSEFLGELCGTPFPAADSPPLRAARGDDRVMSEQIALAFGDWISAECAAHPLVLVLEDLHWGDALTVKLIEGTLGEVKKSALVVLAFGRPEVEETFPRLLAGHRAFSLSLQPLGTKASELLVRGVLGDAIARAPLTRVVQLAGGNALFLEELIRAAVEGEAGDVPATVLAMLQARLSRLEPEARQVLRAGSVFGETFWRGAVVGVCQSWNAVVDVDRWLTRLVEAEILARRRESRFPGDVEYAVRHQLVCEAAAGLSTEADTRSAHLAAGRWLEERGEPDGIVLARHAEQGGDPARAIPFYVRAAEQSISRNDHHEALARAERGIGCGAQAEALGILMSVRASALYSIARWVEAAEVGLAALELLPRGGLWWCTTVEKLFQVLPNISQPARYQALATEMLQTPPAPDARDAFVRALHVQLLGYAISGGHAAGQRCLDFIDRLAVETDQTDIVARGYGGLWRAIFQYILGTDLPLALRLIEQAERDLTESQVMYRVSLARCLLAFLWWGFGDLERGEVAARSGRAAAESIGDQYHTAQSTWYLGLALCEQTDPAKLDEAEACARAVQESHISPLYEHYIPRIITARVAVTRQDWPRAEEEGRQARAGLESLPPYMLMASADLVTGLLRQGKAAEAAVVAREDLARVAALEGPLCTEVLFNVAAAEALYEAGDRAEGSALLGTALAQIEERAKRMSDPMLKEMFLGRRAENLQAFALRDAWGTAGAQ